MNRTENTRAHSRYEIRISAEVATGGQTFTCATRDLSKGGVGLDCDRELTAGLPALVTLFVVVDDVEDLGTDPLELEADIVWCKGLDPEHFAVGLKFGELDAERSAYLDRLLAVAAQDSSGS